MSFSESARRLAAQVSERRAHVGTEEAVKQALILPFLHLLGFDVYDPREVIPEYKAGWAKVAEKIDYALLVGDKLVIFVEAKGPNEVLSNYDPQLAKYFNSTPELKFAVITNGVQYRFFTDLQEPNLLDKKPFFEFDLEQFTDSDIATLERFRKEVFNVNSLVSYAEDLVYLSTLKNEFKRLLREPSDEFTKFVIKSAGLVEGNITQKVVERFRPLVKDGISAAILEIVGQSFMAEVVPQPPSPQVELPLDGRSIEQSHVPPGDGILTTEEELKAFDLISTMLAEHVPDPSKLAYRDTTGYFAVQYGVSTRWFARFFMQKREQKAVVLRLPVDRFRRLAPEFKVEEAPAGLGTSRLYFDTVEELGRLRPVLCEAGQEVVQDPTHRIMTTPSLFGRD
jgi:predicted type IV restriction endonuclease